MRTAGKIVFVQGLPPEHEERVRAAAPGWEVVQGKDSAVWLPHLKDAEIVAGWNRAAAGGWLEAPSSRLAWVHAWGAGVDSFPLAKFRERGVVLTNSSGVHPYPISETVFAMMLAFTRKLHVYVRQQQARMWHHARLGAEMHGRTAGILGVGAIGAETARLAKAFGMRTYGFRRSGGRCEWIDRMCGPAELDELLAAADYIVNALPLTAETAHRIGRPQFARMKPTAFYVNIGRGGTTDTDALIEALREGRIAGAGLDVFETEPLPADSPLWSMENVILTPHSSGSTAHYDRRALEIFLANLRAYIAGEEPGVNRVDLDLQY